MTRNQCLKQKVDRLLHSVAYEEKSIEQGKQNLKNLEEQLAHDKKEGRNAVFELYVSSSHRSFVKFMKGH